MRYSRRMLANLRSGKICLFSMTGLSKIASFERQAAELSFVLISALALLQRSRNIESESKKGTINGMLPSVYLRFG